MRLFRADGQVVWRKQARREREMTLDIEGLPPGLYFLQVQAVSGALGGAAGGEGRVRAGHVTPKQYRP